MAEPIRAIVVDDEPLARRYLRALLSNHPEFSVLRECSDGASAIQAIVDLDPEIVFLDVQMPGQSGFDVVRSIPHDHYPVIVFVTGHDQYALDAFEAQAIDYLLKPFDKDRFDRTVLHVKDEVRRRRLDVSMTSRLPALIAALKASPPEPGDSHAPGLPNWLARIPVKGVDRSYLIPIEEILWVESADSYVTIHTQGKKHLLRESLTWIRANVDPSIFLHIHRRVVVNINAIGELRAAAGGDFTVVLKDGTELPLSRRRRRYLEKLLGHSI